MPAAARTQPKWFICEGEGEGAVLGHMLPGLGGRVRRGGVARGGADGHNCWAWW
jgi:hypothetical protein